MQAMSDVPTQLAGTGQTSENAEEPFSEQLERWLESDEPKTLGAMNDVFAEKAFAVTIMLLMFVPALPLPTGGVTHVFEVITVILASQLVAARQTIWLPERFRRRELGGTITCKAIPFIVRRIRQVERFSRPRGVRFFRQRWSSPILGLILIVFAVAAAFAPPFTGLDTLPALGAVLVALSIILEDLIVLAVGVVVGAGGVVLILTIGAALVHYLRKLL
jgi:hypothetical protein